MTIRRLLPLALLLLAAPAPAAAPLLPLAGRTIAGAPFAFGMGDGRVRIVNFWATWCAPCRAEMPALDAYYRAHRGEGLDVAAIAMDAGGPLKKIARVAAPYAFTVAAIDDVAIPRAERPAALPATLVFARDGGLAYDSRRGPAIVLDAATLDRIVGPLLRR